MYRYTKAYQLKRCKSRTDRLTDYELGEDHSSAECNIGYMFKVLRSNRPEIKIWPIFNLYSKTYKNVV